MSPKAMRTTAVVLGFTVLALLTFGFVMLASTSSAYAYHGDAFYYAKRQAMWLGLGLAACALTARVDYRWYRKHAWSLFIAAAILLIAVLVLGKPIKSATRWFVFGPFRFQPSEFAKYALVIVLAFWLEKMQRAPKGQLRPRIQHWWWGVFAPLGITCGLAVLILKEPDLGTTLLLGAVALTLMWVAGSPGRWLAGIVGAGVAGLVAFLVAIFVFGMFQGSYQVQRIIHWWRGDDLQGSNYQQHIAMLAFGSGGPWGFGLGNSRMKMAYLPEAHTDFIFPIVGEELGLIAALAVVVAFCVLVVCGILLVTRAHDLFGILLGAGIMTVIGLQAIINIAVVTNTIPNKGMPLPFISYGGSSLVMTLAALGVVLNIFWQTQAHAADTLVVSSEGRGL
jgi:cell division protein FtsW